jgi:hypothetical protein
VCSSDLHLYRADINRNTGFVQLPIAGSVFKSNRSVAVQSFVFQDESGRTSPPQAVFMQHQGFVRSTARTARDMIDSVNSIMRLAGVQGLKSDSRLEIPTERMVPPPGPSDSDGLPSEKRYKRGDMAFMLVFNEKAIEDIAKASPEIVARALANSLDAWSRPILDWLMANGQLSNDGRLRYDGRALSSASEFGANDSVPAQAEHLSGMLQDLLRDMAALRAAANPDSRARQFVKMFAGRGEGRLAYADMAKVLVQLVDPLDLSASLAINIKKGVSGDPDVRVKCRLKNRPENPALDFATDAKKRFVLPSELVD